MSSKNTSDRAVLITWFYERLEMFVGNITLTGEETIEAESIVDFSLWLEIAPGVNVALVPAEVAAEILAGDDEELDAWADENAPAYESIRNGSYTVA